MKPDNTPASAAAMGEPAKRLQVLKDRARQLARRPQELAPENEQLMVLCFRVAGEDYGIEADTVRQVHAVKDILPLPGTPPFIAGLVKVWGEIISVTDLRELFDLPKRTAQESRYAIVLRDSDMAMAVLAEEILGVEGVSRQDILPPMPTLSGIKADLLLGVTSGRMAVLDAKALVSDKRLRAGEAAD